MRKLFESLNLNKSKSFEDHLSNPQVIKHVLNDIQQHCRKAGLHKYEIPQRILLCKEVWTPANGLVTVILKIRRKQVYNYYKEDILRLYSNENWMEQIRNTKQVSDSNNTKEDPQK